MKEIDFLPSWYKSDRRQQITYRAQYIALGGIFVLMLVSNLVTSRSLSKAKAELTHVGSMEAISKNMSAEFARVSSEVAGLQRKADVLKKIDSRINVSDVLAELSFLIGNNVLLTRVEFIAEKFPDVKAGDASRSSVVRFAGGGGSDKEWLFWGDVKFKVVLGGIASGTGEVGELVCKLEDSPYFCKVYPSFSRNRQIRTETSVSGQMQNTARILQRQDEGIQVSEFEIVCYLANYTEN